MIHYDRPRQALAIGLAALAGMVDATGFLSAGGYFVSFMSGNTTRLAVDLSTDPSRALMPALLIAGFMGGVIAGAAIGLRAGPQRKFAVLASVTVMLAIGALLHSTGQDRTSLACLVLAMGILNNTFQRDGGVAVGVTYMTGALVRSGQAIGNWLGGGTADGAIAWALLWLGLASGALLGALAYVQWQGLTLWIAAGAALLATIVARRMTPATGG